MARRAYTKVSSLSLEESSFMTKYSNDHVVYVSISKKLLSQTLAVVSEYQKMWEEKLSNEFLNDSGNISMCESHLRHLDSLLCELKILDRGGSRKETGAL